jgi:hypothetical protein
MQSLQAPADGTGRMAFRSRGSPMGLLLPSDTPLAERRDGAGAAAIVTGA